MRSKRLLVGLGLVFAVVGASLLLLLSSGYFEAAGSGKVKSVPRGDQEVAWIAPATSSESWARLVAALNMMKKDWEKQHRSPALAVDLEGAFPLLTAEVPEIGLSFGGGQTLWIRWYKLTGDNPAETWVKKLAERDPAPLAIIGGETTDRAHTLAKALKKTEGGWHGDDPLFLITTATADIIRPEWDTYNNLPAETLPRLIEAYPGRSFRYSFTNTRMAEALLDFVLQNPQVCTVTSADPVQMASLAGLADPWASLGTLAGMGHFNPWYLYGIHWADDSFSRDLGNTFDSMFKNKALTLDLAPPVVDSVAFSTGGFHGVNGPESRAVAELRNESGVRERDHFILFLPTGAQRVRRFVASFYAQAPQDARRFVVVTGDSMNFNHVFRDRETAWNVVEVPLPLVFFSHRLPTDKAAGFNWNASADVPGARTSTHDLLLHRDVVESFLLAAFRGKDLLSDADAIADNLCRTTWHKGRVFSAGAHPGQDVSLFTKDGNRRSGTGEHIVWVQPLFENGRTSEKANISIWGVNAPQTQRWILRPKAAPPVTVNYNKLVLARKPGPEIIYRLPEEVERWMLHASAHRVAAKGGSSDRDDGEAHERE